VEVDGRVVARLPYVVRNRWGLTTVTQPPLTQTLGPWVDPGSGSYTRKLTNEIELMDTLAASLMGFDFVSQNFHYSVRNALPFYWRGFDLRVAYTYVVEDLYTASDLAFFRSHIRRNIRKAQKQVVVRQDYDVDKAIECSELSFRRQGRGLPFDPELVRRLDAACARHAARQMFFAEDARGRIHAALYVVWDARSAYYLFGGADPDLRASGAQSLLVWEAIKTLAGVTPVFDLEGSMKQSIEHFFRGFGATQKSFLNVSKASTRFSLLRAARDLVRRKDSR